MTLCEAKSKHQPNMAAHYAAPGSRFCRLHGARLKEKHVRILVLDPGRTCGYAWTEDKRVHPTQSGVWDLSQRRRERPGAPLLRLARFIADVDPGLVFFERVVGHQAPKRPGKNRPQFGAKAAQFYGAFAGTVMLWCEAHGVAYTAIHFSKAKKLATGHGNAKKELVFAAAKKRWGELVKDNNQADALWLLAAALEEIPR